MASETSTNKLLISDDENRLPNVAEQKNTHVIVADGDNGMDGETFVVDVQCKYGVTQLFNGIITLY